MKKTPILFVLGAIALLVASCATAPKSAPEPAAPLPEAEYQKAKDLRSTIGKYSLDKYDTGAFQKAEASFKEGEAAYGKDNAKAKTALDQAVAGYQQVLDKGFSSLTGERQSQADKAKAEADALKAAVAMKSEYAAALDVYNQARKARDEKQYEKSLELLEQAESLFSDVAAKTREKKARAEQSLSEVESGLKEAEAQAAEAEKLKEGGL